MVSYMKKIVLLLSLFSVIPALGFIGSDSVRFAFPDTLAREVPWERVNRIDVSDTTFFPEDDMIPLDDAYALRFTRLLDSLSLNEVFSDSTLDSLQKECVKDLLKTNEENFLHDERRPRLFYVGRVSGENCTMRFFAFSHPALYDRQVVGDVIHYFTKALLLVVSDDDDHISSIMTLSDEDEYATGYWPHTYTVAYERSFFVYRSTAYSLKSRLRLFFEWLRWAHRGCGRGYQIIARFRIDDGGHIADLHEYNQTDYAVISE